MRTNLSRLGQVVALVTSVLFTSGCNKKPTEPIVVPPPPTPETVSVSAVAPASVNQTPSTFPFAPITIVVTASSTKKDATVTVTCTVDGQNAPCSTNIPVGTHSWCGIGTSSTGMTASNCGSSVVNLMLDTKKVVGFDANGNEYVPAGSWVIYGEGNGKDSTQVGVDGSYSINTRYVGMGNVPVEFRGDNVIRPSFGRTSAEFFASPSIIMGSKVSNTPVCATTGPSKAISIDLEKAYTPAPGSTPDNIPFYYRKVVNGSWAYAVGGYKSWPVKEALDHTTSSSPITASDSTKSFTNLDSLTKAFCTQVFIPANESDVRANGGVLLGVHADAGYSGNTPQLYQGDYLSGQVGFGSNNGFNFFVFAPHESIHALGFGHTCSWVSIMRSSCPFATEDKIMPEDVAYILYMKRVRELERKYNTRLSLSWMHQGERRAKLLTEESVVFVGADGSFETASVPGGAYVVLKP